MASCPECGKNLTECASWPAWGAQLCILYHRAMDCEGVDDIMEDLASLNKVSAGKRSQVVNLSRRIEGQLKGKAGSLNPKCLKKLSHTLAAEIVSGPNPNNVRHMLSRKLKIHA